MSAPYLPTSCPSQLGAPHTHPGLGGPRQGQQLIFCWWGAVALLLFLGLRPWSHTPNMQAETPGSCLGPHQTPPGPPPLHPSPYPMVALSPTLSRGHQYSLSPYCVPVLFQAGGALLSQGRTRRT